MLKSIACIELKKGWWDTNEAILHSYVALFHKMYVMYVTQLRQQNIYCIPAHQYNNNKVVLAGMLALANISVKKDSSVSEFKTYSQMIVPWPHKLVR